MPETHYAFLDGSVLFILNKAGRLSADDLMAWHAENDSALRTFSFAYK